MLIKTLLFYFTPQHLSLDENIKSTQYIQSIQTCSGKFPRSSQCNYIFVWPAGTYWSNDLGVRKTRWRFDELRCTWLLHWHHINLQFDSERCQMPNDKNHNMISICSSVGFPVCDKSAILGSKMIPLMFSLPLPGTAYLGGGSHLSSWKKIKKNML